MSRLRLVLPLLGVLVLLAAAFRVGYDARHVAFVIPSAAQAFIPPLPIPPVTELAPTGDLADVVAYYADHEQQLIDLFADRNRAKALFAMYTVHIAMPYGESPEATTLAEYVTLQRAHCGIYTPVQAEISRALGLTVREVIFAGGWHGWVEVEIDDQWEVFDSTVNVWVSEPMEQLLQGEPRQYRMYYAPAADPEAPDVFKAHLSEGYDLLSLRARLPFLGLEPGTSYPSILPSEHSVKGSR